MILYLNQNLERIYYISLNLNLCYLYMYKIKPLKSARDGIFKTPAQKKYIMPSPGTLNIVGTTGSGKTNLVANLLTNKNMLKDYFDEIYVFCLSPCSTLTDHIKQIKEDNVFTDDDPSKLSEIYNKQIKVVEDIGFKRAKHILVILDDIVQSHKFMNSKILTQIYFGSTHAKFSLWLLSQNYMSIPRKLRLNTHGLILMHGVNNTELSRFSEEYESPYIPKDDFRKIVEYALKKPYSFMFVNNVHPNKKLKFRCGFDQVLEIE